MNSKYPLTKPHVTEESKKYAMEALEQPHQQGDGDFAKRATQVISDLTQRSAILLTPSCTSALEIASMLIRLQPGDEVIMPSFNFTSAAISVTKFGATPVFIDIDPETKCVDVNLIEESLTGKTKAISWVNYAGFTPDLEKIRTIANFANLSLIEDNAHGLGATYNANPLGTTGDYVTYSFHATKNFQCGEGGAIGLRNEKDYRRAQHIREKGTNRIEFQEGHIQKYTWVEQGSSYLLSEVQAAVLLGQIEKFADLQSSRFKLYARYAKNFREICKDFEISGNFREPEEGFASHLFYIETTDESTRERLIHFLRRRSITAAFHYQALHESQAGKKYGKTNQSLRYSEDASKKIVRLPLYIGMSEKDVDEISETVLEFFQGI